MTTQADTQTHQPWCTHHVIDGPEHDLTELNFCETKAEFPGGAVYLHNADGPVRFQVYVENENTAEKGMTQLEAAEFTSALVALLNSNITAGRDAHV